MKTHHHRMEVEVLAVMTTYLRLLLMRTVASASQHQHAPHAFQMPLQCPAPLPR
jgi:hypothetical protein